MTPIRHLLLGLLGAAVAGPACALNLSVPGLAVTENFDSLGVATGTVLPAGWEFSENGSGANSSYGAGNGSSATGNTYSFGATGSTDRALGSLRTSGVASVFGTVITNLTTDTLTELAIEFFGEQWRLGATGRADRLDFAYSLDATSIVDGNWLEFDALDFVSPVTSGATGALDGNASENRTLVAQTLTGLTLPPGASLWIRWTDFDATGSDDGLAIDDFAVRGVAGDARQVPDDLPSGPVAAALLAALMGGRTLRRRGRSENSFS